MQTPSTSTATKSKSKSNIQQHLTTDRLLLERVKAWLTSALGVTGSVVWLQRNHQVSDFIVEGDKRLRLSPEPIGDVAKLAPLASIRRTPKVIHQGMGTIGGQQLHYALIDYVAGETLFSAYPAMSPEERRRVAADLSDFMKSLHDIRGQAYDIGHYIPTLPQYTGLWQLGHQRYAQYLSEQVDLLPLTSPERQILTRAFDFMEAHNPALRQAVGPRLLHNDLHPKNIIVNHGRLAGVIDWECAQFGEPDFELSHIVHWSLCPEPDAPDFRTIAEGLLSAHCNQFPKAVLAARITIYQLEHEIHQLVWCRANEARWAVEAPKRLARIEGWLDGLIERLLR